jgi:hypothetical protein
MIPKEKTIHHTNTPRDSTTLESINEFHRDVKGFSVSSLGYNIGYHWLIFGDGKRIQTRREDEIGMHSPPNEGKIGIGLVGAFETEQASDAQLIELGKLLSEIDERYGWKNDRTYGHFEINTTLCPGKNLIIWLLLKRQIRLLRTLLKLLQLKVNRALGGNPHCPCGAG